MGSWSVPTAVSSVGTTLTLNGTSVINTAWVTEADMVGLGLGYTDWLADFDSPVAGSPVQVCWVPGSILLRVTPKTHYAVLSCS